jgi:hypothetical protein
MKRFERVKTILEEAVEGQDIGAHGNFWRPLTLEQFKVKKVIGKQLVEVGNGENSNLIKALEGRAPFGNNIGTPGANFPQMPAGFPPVVPEKIAVIKKWIDDGCPDEEETEDPAVTPDGGPNGDTIVPPVTPDGGPNDGPPVQPVTTDTGPNDGPPVPPVTPDTGPEDDTIARLMAVPEAEQGVDWLKKALQAALKLELATIPPYLCAIWSIDDSKLDTSDPEIYNPITSLKSIVVEEMWHMGLVCNMLTTLGFTPELNTPAAVPTYPGPLPGGVNPTLTVSIRKLCRSQLDTFIEIEKPDFAPFMPLEAVEEFATIGAFYNAIQSAFQNLPAGSYKNERQIEIGELFAITDFSKVQAAIGLIKSQGEGTEQSPEQEANVGDDDLAHFYRFRELLWGKRFVQNAEGHWINGEKIPFPAVLDMADIPAGGYKESHDFDVLYTQLLNSLQKMWETGDSDEFGNAYGIMTSMEEVAKVLMQTPIDPNDPGKGNFGPSFLLIDQAAPEPGGTNGGQQPGDHTPGNGGTTTMPVIKQIKIHPSIGVARIGNHPSEFFIGPELPNGFIKSGDIGGFKAPDASDGNDLKIKRQGARFRVFAYFEDGTTRELTSEEAEITWKVKIANTKAMGLGFYGVFAATPDGPRNNFVNGEADRKGLGLEPAEVTISGNNDSAPFEPVRLKVKDVDGTVLSSGDIRLGECKTDDKGRLIVLGGSGNSGSVKNVPIGRYDDNDYWYDDIADGYVKARVKLKNTGEEIDALDSWVLCVPPKYVPEMHPIITMYDTLFNKHFLDGRIQADEKPHFFRDIYPILLRASHVPFLHEMPGRHFSMKPLLAPDSAKPARKKLYDRIRKPDGAGGVNATMPKSFGDGYRSGVAERLLLTAYQLRVLSKWVADDFVVDDIQITLPAQGVTASGLDQAALENCIGAAFFPGIEAGWFLRDKYHFVEPFRLNSTEIVPGDVTKQMALPWQADFWACSKEDPNDGPITWWPFARPDDVRFEGASASHPWTPDTEFSNGYQDMVDKWMKLGFVVEKDGKFFEVQRQIPPSP